MPTGILLSLVLVLSAQATPDARPSVTDPTVRTEGSLVTEGVAGTVTVRYDRFGVPDVEAPDRAGAYFAEGFLHAQNRYTQMDVTRRLAAGEISALVGRAALGQDLRMRALRLRTVAAGFVERLDPEAAAQLGAYVDGVNAGLSDLRVPPPEYAILRVTPEPWTLEDTILVMLAFSSMLDSSGDQELRNAAMFDSLPLEVREYLHNPISRFDAPVPGLERRRPSLPRIPTRDVISLRDLPDPPPTREFRHDMDDDGPGGPGSVGDGSRLEDERRMPGSNNWAIGARLTRDGRAILASDPHLQLQLPGTWYRIRLRWPDHDVVGISLPGVPGVVMGSNGSVAWGFTNLTGDLQDIIAIEIDPDDPGRYRTADGWEPFGRVTERIGIAGEEPHELELLTTRWGVVNATWRDREGVERSGVREWATLHPELVNMNILGVEETRTVDQALDVLAGWNGPPQNAVVVDSAGRVGYTITGFLPDRDGREGRAPRGRWDGSQSWTDRDPLDRPRISGPDVDFVFTANNRTVDQRVARQLGYAWAHPGRARRIRDVLSTLSDADEAAMLELQMDTTTVGLEPWRTLVLDVIPEDETDESLLAAREAILEWNGRADVDQVGATLLSSIRMRSLEELSAAVADWAGRSGLGSFDEAYLHEEPYLRVIEDRAPNWLPPGEDADWPAWLRRKVGESVAEGALRPWGESNRITIASPFADLAPPAMRGMLELDAGPQSGHWNAPKVLMPGFGASARLVVSPSNEADGILLTPGGQSGNPLSPHFRSLNASWLEGEPMPLLPGAPVATFTLEPPSEDGAG